MNPGPTPPGRPPQAPTPRASQPISGTVAPRSTVDAPADENRSAPGEAPAPGVSEPATPEAYRRSSPMRLAWITLGLGLTALGGLGIVLPGLPSTMFFVGAAACFSRSSTRFERWLLSIPVVGTLVDDYREGRGMPVTSKAITVFLITAFSTLAVMRVDVMAVKWIIGVAAAMGITAVTFHVPTRRSP